MFPTAKGVCFAYSCIALHYQLKMGYIGSTTSSKETGDDLTLKGLILPEGLTIDKEVI